MQQNYAKIILVILNRHYHFHPMDRKLEICCDSIHSALIAEQGGADRIELCSALDLGGLTPGMGLIQKCTAQLHIPVYVLIRPRQGDFLYSQAEFDIMLSDIELALEAGAEGIVSGVLKTNGSIDIERTKILIDQCRGAAFTFHRAFDMCCDPLEALEQLIDLGAHRILSSGQSANALEGAEMLGRLQKAAGERIRLMAGHGVRPANLPEILAKSAVQEVHLSARKTVQSKMEYQNPHAAMGKNSAKAEYAIQIADIEMIKEIKNILTHA